MTFPEVQFVASPDVGAAVRFDFNQAGSWSTDQVWPAHDGVSLGAPTLEGDPDGIGTEYGFRRLSFDLIIVGTHASAATKVSALAKELVRQTNWLRVRMTPTSVPVWFKTYRSAPSALNFEHVYASDDVTRNTFGVSIELDADAFAYGARVTQTAVTINNSPVAATNPMWKLLPTVVGDAPAPARFEIVPSGAVTYRQPLLSVAGLNQAPVIWPTTNLVGGTDTTSVETTGAGTGYVSGDYRRISFATNTALTNRLAGAPFVFPATMPPGKYRVLVRVSRTDTTSRFTMRLRQQISVLVPDVFGPAVPFGGAVTSPAVNRAAWVDLGVFSWPTNLPPDDAQFALPQGPSISFEAGRASGSGSLDVDVFMLIPVPDNSESVRSLISFGPNAGDKIVVDGDGEYVGFPGYVVGPDSVSGAFPMLRPDGENSLYYVEQTLAEQGNGTFNDSDVLTRSSVVTVSYRPRWLYLAAS